MQDTRIAKYLLKLLEYVQGDGCNTLTCPHRVILGAVGGDRQIGHVVRSSSSLYDPAIGDLGGKITCRISSHWKNLVNNGKRVILMLL